MLVVYHARCCQTGGEGVLFASIEIEHRDIQIPSETFVFLLCVSAMHCLQPNLMFMK